MKQINHKILLLVEDNEDDVELTQRALRQHNLANKVVVARDGQEALDYIFREGTFSHITKDEEPQLVLLDLQLPKIGGLEVLRRIRGNKETKFLPVVILTTSKEESDIVNSYTHGANSYIRKPVDFEQFSHAVRQLGLYWLVLNEVPSQ